MENRKVKSRCIFVHDGAILLCYNKEYDYYFFPGGSQNADELPENTLRREILEEFGSQIENIKTLEVLKNVGESSNETITMFQADFSNKAIYKQTKIPLLDMPEIKAVWVSITDIQNKKLKIFPEYNYLKFLQTN